MLYVKLGVSYRNWLVELILPEYLRSYDSRHMRCCVTIPWTMI